MPKMAPALSALEVSRITERGAHAVGVVPGLLLVVAKGGSRSWVLRARVGIKRRDIGLGGYPAVTLAGAREAARGARAAIRDGKDVLAERRKARQALIDAQRRRMTFAEAARAKHAVLSQEFRSTKHARLWLSTLKRYAFPIIGTMDVADVDMKDVLRVLRPIWETKTDTAQRVRQRIESVLTWATVTGHRTGDNPATWRGNLAESLPKPAKLAPVTHRPALAWQEIPDFMERLRKRNGTGARALELLILTAARSGEVRGMEWDEVDFTARLWRVPAQRMKGGKAHTVPLSDAALALIQAQPHMQDSRFVFAAARGGRLSDMSISAVCRRMGVAAVPHGFRASFKSWAQTRTAYTDEVSELCLAHVNNDATRAAYARNELLPQRARMLAEWAKFCTSPAPKVASVTPIRKARA